MTMPYGTGDACVLRGRGAGQIVLVNEVLATKNGNREVYVDAKRHELRPNERYWMVVET